MLLFSYPIASVVQLDLGFLLGAGGVNAARDLEIQKRIAKDMLNAFDISPQHTRVGLIQYGRDSRLVARLNRYTDKRTLNHVIGTVSSTSSETRLDKALDMARSDLFDVHYGARKDIPKTLLVFTNKAVDSSSQDAAEKLKDLGVKVIVIGVGQQVDKKQLEGIAGSNKEVFVAANPDDAKNVVNDIAKASMPGMFGLK